MSKLRNTSQFVSQVGQLKKPGLPPLLALPSKSDIKPEKESTWQKFKIFLKDTRLISGGLQHLSRLQILNKFKDFLETASKGAAAVGYGAKRPKKSKMIKDHDKLIRHIMKFEDQSGTGIFDTFKSWISSAASKVGSVAKTVGSKIGDVAGKVFDYAKSKPLSTLGTIAKIGSFLPTPLAPFLGPASTALGLAGTLTGRGNQEGGIHNQNQKLLMVF